jgi:hypothetical protein
MSESHLSVTFIAAGTLRSRHSARVSALFIRAGIVRAMFIRAVIVRDLVRDRVNVRATLVRATSLGHMIYSLIDKMNHSLDLRFNRAGSEAEVDSTKSPPQPT